MYFFSRKTPLVSVAMASYNHARFVAQAVESVLGQTLTDLELIVVDDGSTDGTPDIVASFRDPRLKLISIKKNRAIHSRNHALMRCTGRFIAFQNSDDVWSSEKLEQQVEELESDKETSACFTSVEIINAKGERDIGTWAEGLFQNRGRAGANWLRWFFDHGNCLCFPSAVVRNKDLRAVGMLRESLVQLPDYDLWIRLAAMGNFSVLDGKLTQYRVVGYENQGAPTQDVQQRAAVEHVEVLMRYVEPLLLDRFESIFPGLVTEVSVDILKQASLARYAAKQEGSRFRFLADRIWQSLYDKPTSRNVLVRHFGSKMFREFLKNRACLQLDFLSK